VDRRSGQHSSEQCDDGLALRARRGLLLAACLLLAAGAQAQYLKKVVTLPFTGAGWGLVSIAYNPSEHLLYAPDAKSDTIWVFDERRSVPLYTISAGARVAALYYDQSVNRLYASACLLAFVYVFSGRGHAPSGAISLPDIPCRLVPDTLHNRLFALCGNGVVAVIDCRNDDVEALIRAVASFEPGSPATYAEALNRLYVGCRADRTVVGIDCTGDSVIGRTTLDSIPVGLCYHEPNSRLYCSCARDSVLHVIDVQTNAIVDSVPGAGGCGAMCSNPLGNKVYAGFSVIDGRADTVRARFGLEVGEEVSTLTWCPGGNKVYVTSAAW